MNWLKNLIRIRREHLAFSRGTVRFLPASSRAVLPYLCEYEGDVALVVNNLAHFSQYVELDLSEFIGQVPVDLFSKTAFPAITERPYLITLGPHGFYWFRLQIQT